MKPQRRKRQGCGNAAVTQIGFAEGARDRLCIAEQAPGGFRILLPAWSRGHGEGCRRRRRLVEKGAHLVKRFAEMAVSAIEAYEVKEIAAITGCRIRPTSRIAARKPDIEALALGPLNISHNPIMPLAASMGKVVLTDRLGPIGETPREVSDIILVPIRHDHVLPLANCKINFLEEDGERTASPEFLSLSPRPSAQTSAKTR